MIIMERKWREHVECVLRKDICMRRSKAVISTCIQGYISIRNIRNSHRPRPDTQLGLMDSHQSMQTMPRCQWISLWGRYATHSTKMLAPPRSLSHALPLSLPRQPTPITDIDAKQRRRKMKIEKQAAALVEKKTTTSTKKNTRKKQKEIQQQRKTLKY